MRKEIFPGMREKGKDVLPDDDIDPSEVVGQIEPADVELFQEKKKNESKTLFENLGFVLGDRVRRKYSSSAVKEGKIVDFFYMHRPVIVFAARVKEDSGSFFAISTDEIAEGTVEKIYP